MKLRVNSHVAVVDGESFTLFRNEGQIFDPKLAAEDRPELDVTNFSAGIRHQDDTIFMDASNRDHTLHG